jgi:hypothetical protein
MDCEMHSIPASEWSNYRNCRERAHRRFRESTQFFQELSYKGLQLAGLLGEPCC